MNVFRLTQPDQTVAIFLSYWQHEQNKTQNDAR